MAEVAIDRELNRIVDDRVMRGRLANLIQARNAVRIREKSLAVTKAKITTELEEILTELGLDELTHDGLLLKRFTSHNTQLRRDLLLSHNVSPNVLAQCTVTRDFSVVSVRDLNEREVEDANQAD